MKKERTIAEQVTSGFRIAGYWLLGMLWLGFVYAGLGEAFGTEAEFNEGHHPSRILGWALLFIASLVFVLTANSWKKAFPAIMSAATFNSLLILERGHNLNSSEPVPRSIGLILFLVFACMTYLSFTFKQRSLGVLDRMALLAFAVSIFAGAVWGGSAQKTITPYPLVAGAFCVVIAWMINRFRKTSPL